MTNNGYSPEAIKAARQYHNGNPDYRREFDHLAMHPEDLPEDTRPADPWQPFTLADAYLDRPPIQYIAAGLFALPSLNIVYGAPGTLKSFILADLAVCVAGGNAWLPPAPWNPGANAFKTLAGPVMWLDFDNGAIRTHERIGALARVRKLPVDTPFEYYSMPAPWLDASKPESVGMLTLRAKRFGAKLIIIDNLGNVSGGVDENSGAMINVMAQLRQLSEESGAAVVAIHHQRKGSNGGGNAGRAGDTLRGHSSIEASLDLAIRVDREEGADTISLKSTKTRGVDVDPFSAGFTHEENDSGALHTAIFYGLPTEDTTSDRAIERAIKAVLVGAAMNQGNLVKAVTESLPGLGHTRIENKAKLMAANGVINSTRGKDNAIIYTL